MLTLVTSGSTYAFVTGDLDPNFNTVFATSSGGGESGGGGGGSSDNDGSGNNGGGGDGHQIHRHQIHDHRTRRIKAAAIHPHNPTTTNHQQRPIRIQYQPKLFVRMV